MKCLYASLSDEKVTYFYYQLITRHQYVGHC